MLIKELSGDLMPDLSTPLLDAVHNKLRDPSLDCKKAGLVSIVPSDYTMANSHQNLIGDSPSPAPSTAAPTEVLLCPDNFNGPMMYNGCSGKFTYALILIFCHLLYLTAAHDEI